MKTVIIGDIHGRTIWSSIVSIENPDRVIFLGDYVSTHEGISSKQQIENLKEILDYKESALDKVILLRGNHDVQHLGYYWAECSGRDLVVEEYLNHPDNMLRYLQNTQWVYVDEDLKTIFSHAGVSQVWMDNNNIKKVEDINSMQPSEAFGFTPNSYYDYYGNSITQPPTWIRPQALVTCNVLGYDQVVGHTPVNRIEGVYKSTKGKQTLWFCDALGVNSYLVIEDREFTPKTYLK